MFGLSAITIDVSFIGDADRVRVSIGTVKCDGGEIELRNSNIASSAYKISTNVELCKSRGDIVRSSQRRSNAAKLSQGM